MLTYERALEDFSHFPQTVFIGVRQTRMCFFLIHPTHDSGSALIDVSHEFSLRASILISVSAIATIARSQESPLCRTSSSG